MDWVCVSLLEQKEDAWLVVGAPKKVSAEALLSVRSLVNQVTLALRNSDVHQELTMQARVDALTGLANRAAFTAELANIAANHGHGTTSQILFLDLDDFKDVNDILGHRAGDDLLIEVANRLRRCTRPDDVCARLGGDEFAVVLRGATEETAVDIAQRMVESIAEPIDLNGQIAQVGASIGIAIGTPQMSMDELVHQADVAMYAAKACGKGRMQDFNPGLLQADTYRVSFESQLARATGEGELVVHYQPILSVPDYHCIAIEALVRWQHPQQGLLEPEKFIRDRRTDRAIHGIGAFVLEQACAEAATWKGSRSASPVAVHVNVSAKQLDDDHFVELVRRSLVEHGIPASRLVLELTETVGLHSPAAILRLDALAAPRRRDRDRRFRHRLLVAHHTPVAAGQRDQARPHFHRGRTGQSHRPHGDRGHHPDERPPGSAHHRRRHRTAGSAAVPGADRLRRGPGLPLPASRSHA